MLSRAPTAAKVIGYGLFAAIWLFLLTRYLTFWLDWPSITQVIKNFSSITKAGWLELLLILIVAMACCYMAYRYSKNSLMSDARFFSRAANYVVRAAFWSVLLVGLTDAAISMLRIEGGLAPLVGDEVAQALGRSTYRGTYVHFPLIGLSIVIAFFTRSLNFIWLSLLVVLAEFAIVLSRFVFSYEQSFMSDLVRFWYASLFLFASAHTLLDDAHVRVDVLFANFSRRAKALVNTYGSLLLGLPVCWVILLLGMGTKQSSLISPLLNFEVSQSSYGMYVKYLMSLLLPVFAVSMAIKFISYYFSGLSILRQENEPALFVESSEH